MANRLMPQPDDRSEDHRLSQAVTTGTAVSGLFVCVLRIITKAAGGHGAAGLRLSSYVYFSMSAVIAGICIVLDTCVMPSLPVIRYYSRSKACKGQPAFSGEAALLAFQII
eukprot:scaffold208475_cov43-Prasinocladus_malaysianus.AAC.1